MQNYHNLISHILASGIDKSDRTGVGTKSVFGHHLRYDLTKGFPLLTTKRTHFKSIAYELLWFLSGSSNIKFLKDNGASFVPHSAPPTEPVRSKNGVGLFIKL